MELDASLELAGLAALTTAAFFVSLPLGIAVLGACLLLVGYLLERR